MLGLKCKVPDQLLSAASRCGALLTVRAGDNVVRLLPPLIVSEAEIDEACARSMRLARRGATGAPRQA